MANFQDSYLSGSNIEFIEALYERFLEDPSSVDPSWRDFFERNRGPGRPIHDGNVRPHGEHNGNGNGYGLAGEAMAPYPPPPYAWPYPPPPGYAPPAYAPRAQAPAPAPVDATAQYMGLQARVDQTVYAFRLRGHLLAKIDPLGRPRPPLDHAADVGMANSRHFSDAELQQYVDSTEVFPERRVRLADLLERLRRTYCGHIGVEFQTLLDSDRRRWLMPRMEHNENRDDLSVDEQRQVLRKLSYAEAFESFLHTKYVGAKRFSLDGGESLIPMLSTFLEEGGRLGVDEVVIGMAHRGRLNVLTNILGKSPEEIFSEFEGPENPSSYLSRGDVKYHQGFSSDYRSEQGKKIHLSLAFNPSHLEAVDPVVLGRVRAKQDRFGDAELTRAIPVLIHGDAAFIGQGVVQEILNLSELKGYQVGGTVHLVVNNQVGFTTEPSDARSSMYCTAIAQMLDIPIFHVNGDDPEACVHVMRLATQYRQHFKSDVVIDLVCYRRYGHNEGDEPAFTQPTMYELIRGRPTVRKLYAEDLVRRGRITEAEAEAIRQQCMKEFQEAHAKVREESQFKEPSAMEGLWKHYRGGLEKDAPATETGVKKERLQELLVKTFEVPDGFTLHPKLARLAETRHAMAEGKHALDWAAGEALGFATLLSEGYDVRLTGQDTERGTFSHRHAVLHDVKTGETYTPLKRISKSQGQFRVFNSPLSEMGCLGFEFGYSLDCPDCLVIWEAQFGDFANNAQVIIDQFIVAAEQKWRRLSGLTLLLPHGYEGQGPEHSSARLERFLGLCGGDNIQVCYPTTPAQLFHLLRRQILRPYRKPLIVMSPKSLLRKPEAVSALDELSSGTFQRVLPDAAIADPKAITRLVLCSGKVYYDLLQERDKRKDAAIALVRLEQLYPFPMDELGQLVSQMPKLEELVWVQEEPKNMGAWRYIFHLLSDVASSAPKRPSLGYVGRAESASPATGYHEAHVLEQQLIIEEALSRGGKNGR